MGIDKLSNNDGQDWDNIEFLATAVGDYTIYVTGTGVDTDTTKYLNKGSCGKGFILRPDAVVSIVGIDTKTFRDPITITTAGFSISTHLRDFQKIVIRVQAINTQVRLLVL
jgi:hypothetical protein